MAHRGQAKTKIQLDCDKVLTRQRDPNIPLLKRIPIGSMYRGAARVTSRVPNKRQVYTARESMKVSRVESARNRLIERYVIQGVDERLTPREIASQLNGSIKAGTGRLFDEEAVTGLLDLYGFPEYATWQAASTTDSIN